MVVTTVYGTLGPDSVAQAIQEGCGTTVLCNRKNVEKLIAYSKEMPTLKHIIYTNEAVPAEEARYDRKAKGSDDEAQDGCYCDGIRGAYRDSRKAAALPPNFTHLAYLPLAHIFEMAVQIGVMSMGARIGYADPKTLTQTGARPIGALEEFRPHLFMGVPKIYDVIMKAAGAKLKKESPGKQQLVASAFEWKARAMEGGRYTPVFDMLIFNKFKHILGGNVVVALSGGGPLAATVQRWVRTAFGCQVIQGYALTETCAGATLQMEYDYRPGVVGPPVPGAEISLRSCVGADGEPEVLDKRGCPYLNTDTEDSNGNPCLGRGEVLIRGPVVTDGYYKLPEKTAEAFRKDGWFLTGDVGVWYPDGSLGIMDRVKNLVKLHGGEYIAMENMELIYGGSQYVDAVNGGIMTYGDGTLDRPVALVQVNELSLTQWAKTEGSNSSAFSLHGVVIQDLVKNPKAEEEVLKSLLECHKNGGLSGIEKLAGVGLVCEPWTAQNKCLTATNKISRHAVIARDGEILERVKAKGRFLFDQVSRNKAASLKTWNTYCSNFLMPVIDQLTIDEMLTVIRSMVGRLLNDLAKLDSLDDMTTRTLCRATKFDESILCFSPEDNFTSPLQRLVQALSSLARLDALTSNRREVLIRRVCGQLSFMEPFQLSMLMHALVIPDWGDGPIEHQDLLLNLLRYASKGRGEFTFPQLHEILTSGYALQASGVALPRDVILFMGDAERIVEDEGRKAVAATSAHLEASVVVQVSNSKFQESIKGVLKACDLEYEEEVVAGTYILDYAVGSLALEADGFTHFYAGTENFTAKTKLKHRILRSLGWTTVSLPYFEMKNRGLQQRTEYFVNAIEKECGAGLSQIRKLSRLRPYAVS
ncbi:Long-chain-fatty-acid--CoA ligase 3 [Perkinsus olseni]|uniref:Long-chain-fatty-acid--CoA ligase 3 n=1 Tax=Perkinsus olseni TaxID=32597 RepID=A0A7J6PG87_PEROL|nr:Long-chain-fatty-acid--CoA ligase 3 [Perkinsus olseni]